MDNIETIVIIDHGLKTKSGHALSLASTLLKQAAAKGITRRVVGHRDCSFDEIDGVEIEKYLTAPHYDIPNQTNPLDRINSFDKARDELVAVLNQLGLTTQDLVIFPTATAAVKAGVSLYISNNEEPAHCACFAMMPPGICENPDDNSLRVYDPIDLLMTQMAVDALSKNTDKVVWFTSNEDHARGYQSILSRPVPYLPLPLVVAPSTQKPKKSISLYLGDVRTAKGFGLLPEIVEYLAPRLKKWTLSIHATPNPQDAETASILQQLQTLSERFSNLIIQTEYLSRSDFEALVQEQSILVLPYEPSAYAHQSSGLLNEAIAAGLLLVVPDNTLVSHEMSRFGGAGTTFDAHTANAISKAVIRTARRSILMKRKAKKSAKKYTKHVEERPIVDAVIAWHKNGSIPGDLTRPPFSPKTNQLFDLSKCSVAGWFPLDHGVLWAKEKSVLLTADVSKLKIINKLHLGLAIVETEYPQQQFKIRINGDVQLDYSLPAGNHELVLDLPGSELLYLYVEFFGYTLSTPTSGDARKLAIGVFHAYVT